MDREEATQALELLRRVVGQARDDSSLQNWGLIWIFNGLTNATGFITTDFLLRRGYTTPPAFVLLWVAVLGTNLLSILALKSGAAGVRSFVENQIWLIWTTFIVSAALTCILNYMLGLSVIFAAPMLAILGAGAFAAMGGVMGRRWFAYAAVWAASAFVMALVPQWQFTILGVLWGVGQTTGGIFLVLEKRKRLASGAAEPRLV